MHKESQIYPGIVAKVLGKREDAGADFFLSVSKAKTFDLCKAKFKYQYIERLPKKSWDFQVFGQFLHAVLENFHELMLEDPSRDWNKALIKGWHVAKKEYEDRLTIDQEEEAKKILKKYKAILIQGGLPNVIANEKNFYIEINKNILLNGFIDRIEIDPDDVLHVSDYKTTKNKKYLKNDFFQLETYAFALMLEDPDLQRVRTSYIMLRHDFDYMTKEYTRDDIMPLGKKFIEYAERIEKEKLWRPTPQFLCKFCDFLDNCRDGSRFLTKSGISKPQTKKVGVVSW